MLRGIVKKMHSRCTSFLLVCQMIVSEGDVLPNRLCSCKLQISGEQENLHKPDAVCSASKFQECLYYIHTCMTGWLL